MNKFAFFFKIKQRSIYIAKKANHLLLFLKSIDAFAETWHHQHDMMTSHLSHFL